MEAIIGAIIGFFISIFLKIGDAFIKEKFTRREETRKNRQIAAKDINTFVIEGMKIGFRHKPKNEGIILLRATEIEAINEEVGKKLRVFLYSWMQNRNFLKNHPDEVEREKMAMQFRNDAQKNGEELLVIAKKWTK